MVSLMADPLVSIATTIPFFTAVKRGQRKLALIYKRDSAIPASAITPIVVTRPSLKRNIKIAAPTVRVVAMTLIEENAGKGMAPQLFT
jgi:hypothetical protein